MLPNLSGLNLGCATDAQWGAGEETYESLMDEPVYDSNGVQVNRGLPDEELGKISKALELLQRVVELPRTETFPTLEEMNARNLYKRLNTNYGDEWDSPHDPGKLYEMPIEYPDAWRDFTDYMGFSGFTDPRGLTDVYGRPWTTNVHERRKRALLSWGTSMPTEQIRVPPTDQFRRNEKVWGRSRFFSRIRQMDPWMKANVEAFMYIDRYSSKKRRRELIYQYVEAVVYDACRSQETRATSFFNPHGKSWSSIAQRIIDWITLGAVSLPPMPGPRDGRMANKMWNDMFAHKPPYPFGSPILFIWMMEYENAPESYAFMPDDFKVDPGVYFPFALGGVEDAVARAMKAMLTYVHLSTVQEMRDDPAHNAIVHHTGNSPGYTPEDFVAYMKDIEAFANTIAEKVDSPAVREMHGALLEWLHSPDRPLGRQTYEDARQDFETTERKRAIEEARREFKKRQATQPLRTVTKKRRESQAMAFASMVAFHGKAAVQRWRIAEHLCAM